VLRIAVTFLLLSILLSVVNSVRGEPGLFREVLTLETGQVMVIEESSLEPRSIGSYSLKLYSGERPEFPYDRYLTGLVQARDGVLEAAMELAPRHCDGCVMVCLRSAGSGSYLTRHIFSYTDRHLVLRSMTSQGPTEETCEDVGEMRIEWGN
jgi:hypothetical protein